MNVLPDAFQYRLALALELLRALEADSLNADPLLKMARRLANALGRSEIERWLGWELAGYPGQPDTEAQKWMIRMGRQITRPNSLSLPTIIIYRENLPRIEDSAIPQMDKAISHNRQTKSFLMKRASLPGARQTKIDESKWEESERRSYLALIDMAAISKSVRVELHRWVSEEYHRIAFADVAEAIFLRYKAQLDTLLFTVAPEVVEKLPAIYERLRAGEDDPEAVAHAMLSCRRMIAAFADAVRPADATPVRDENGIEHRVTKADSLNRISAYIASCTPSKSRRERMQKLLGMLHDRVSSGIKNDMTADEAQALFVLTYVTLGEAASVPITP